MVSAEHHRPCRWRLLQIAIWRKRYFKRIATKKPIHDSVGGVGYLLVRFGKEVSESSLVLQHAGITDFPALDKFD